MCITFFKYIELTNITIKCHRKKKRARLLWLGRGTDVKATRSRPIMNIQIVLSFWPPLGLGGHIVLIIGTIEPPNTKTETNTKERREKITRYRYKRKRKKKDPDYWSPRNFNMLAICSVFPLISTVKTTRTLAWWVWRGCGLSMMSPTEKEEKRMSRIKI